MAVTIERRQGERSLHEQERLYRTLVEQIPATVYVNSIGADYVPIYTSPGLVGLLGAPVTDPASPLFGVVRITQINLPRSVELGFRYSF